MRIVSLVVCAVLVAQVHGVCIAAQAKGTLRGEVTSGGWKEAVPARAGAPAKRKVPAMRAMESSSSLPDAPNLVVDVSAEYMELKGDARFVVKSGSQSNHVVGGDKAFKVKHGQGTGVEFKKWGFIVNVLPVIHPEKDDEVHVQLQVELSGPVKGVSINDGDIPSVLTWQHQGALSLKKGVRKAIFQSPGRVEILIDVEE